MTMREIWTRDSPQTEIVLEHTFTAKRIEVERASKRHWVCTNGLREEDKSVTLRDIEPIEHTIGENIEGDLPSIRGQVAMIGERIQTRAWSTCYGTCHQRRTFVTSILLVALWGSHHHWDQGQSTA
jgi:hypothetical protein